MRLLKWIIQLFDNRSEYEKEEDAKIVAAINKLSQTHHIIVGKRGSIRIVKRD